MRTETVLSDPGPLPELNWLPVDKCQVDRRYQRSLESARSQAQIKRIVERFRWPAFGAVMAVKRDDHWLIIDGQHRCAAAKLRGFAHVPAVVVAELSLEDQAAAFIEANRERTPVNQFQVFHAMVASGDALACELARMCAKAEIIIPRYVSPAANTTEGTTLAIGTLLALARRYKSKASLPIGAVAEAYRDIKGGLRAPFFDGAARFIFSFPDEQQKAAASQAAAYFKSKSPDEVASAMALAIGQGGQVTRGKAIADLIAQFSSLKPTSKHLPKKAGSAAAPPVSAIANARPQVRKVSEPRPDEESQIAAFLAKNGATTFVDWGVHQKIVDAAHSMHFDVSVPVNGQGRKRWWLNGAYVDTKELYKRVNAELERRHMKLVAMPKDVA